MLLIIVLLGISLFYILFSYFRIRGMEEGTDEMVRLSGIIRSGSSTFLITEYKHIVPVLAVVAVLITLFIEKTCALTFLLGGSMSSLACVLGMKSATYANVRTANKARKTGSIGETVRVALCGGSISGLAVQTFGMAGFISPAGSHMMRCRTEYWHLFPAIRRS